MTEQNKNQVSFRMIKASEEDYKYCYTLYENNMKKITSKIFVIPQTFFYFI